MSDNHQKEGMFEIKTASDFFEKVKKDYQYFSENISDSSAAMNCIIFLHHLHEWVWYTWLEDNISAQAEFKIKGKKLEGCKQFGKHLSKKCPHFDLLRKLANGTKHCKLINGTHPKTEQYRYGGFFNTPPTPLSPWFRVRKWAYYLVKKST